MHLQIEGCGGTVSHSILFETQGEAILVMAALEKMIGVRSEPAAVQPEPKKSETIPNSGGTPALSEPKANAKMEVAVEYIKWLQQERAKINSMALEDITFLENGTKLDMPKELIKKFAFAGLNNIDFILSGFYKTNNASKDK